MISCTFAGHRVLYHSDLKEKIENSILSLLQSDSHALFYLGGMGEFDYACVNILHIIRKKYPHYSFSIILVLPYMIQQLNLKKDYFEYAYDEIILPAELDDLHYKAAIPKRNQWMIDHSEYLITYLFRNHGGAWNTIRYAEKKKKTIIPLIKQ